MSKKILFVSYDMLGFGGRETVCKNVYLLMKAKDPSLRVEFLFFKEDDPLVKINDDWLAGIPFSRISSAVNHYTLRRLHLAWKLSRIIKQKSIDIIICADSMSCYITSWSKRFTCKKFISYSWMHLSLAALYKNKYAVYADYCLAISSANSQWLIARGVNKQKVFTIYNPITYCADTIPRPDSGAVFIYVGRLCAVKNLTELLQGLAAVSGNYCLHIIGSGADEQTLRSLADKLGINVIWHSWQTDPWHYINSAIGKVSALLLTSTVEGFPMILGEAIARGIYCISADCPCGPDDIINQNNGELYQLQNIAMLSAKLQNIIDGKPLPDQQTIKNSITPLYAEHYIEKLFTILKLS